MQGRTFGKLEVVYEAPPKHHKEAMWLCRCKCGNTAVYSGNCLRSGHATTCGQCLRYRQIGDTVIATDVNEKTFVFDAADFDTVNKYRWFVNGHGYVCADDKNRKRISLHRLLMGFPDEFVIDHINGDKTDCRRMNLRLASNQQNSFNAKTPSNNTTGYKGVHYDPGRNKYEAYIRPNGRKIHLGRYDSPIDAALAYDKAAFLYFGEFARPNFRKEDTDEKSEEVLELEKPGGRGRHS